MPIDLNNITQQLPKITYTPKFFSRKLTGNGNASGILNHLTNPNTALLALTDRLENIQNDVINDESLGNVMQSSDHDIAKYGKNYKNRKVDYFSLLPYNNIDLTSPVYDQTGSRIYYGDKYETVNLQITLQDLLNDKLGEWTDLGDGRLKIRMLPKRVRLFQQKTALSTHWNKSIIVGYNVQILVANSTDAYTKSLDALLTQAHTFQYALDRQDQQIELNDDQDILNPDLIKDIITDLLGQKQNLDPSKNFALILIDTMLPKELFAALSPLLKTFNNESSYKGTNTYESDFNKYLKDYLLYPALCQVSESFQTNICHFVDVAYKSYHNYQPALEILINNLNQVKLPLDQYQKLYQYLTTNITDKVQLDNILESNLNFRFNTLLTELKKEKANLALIPHPTTVQKKLSFEQKQAVMAPGPLTLVEAGAGTGKSSVLLSRIQFLIDGGIKPDDILTLSFTNAAAQHIRDCFPGVNAMTINSLVNKIYQANYQKQMIVSPKSFQNALEIDAASLTANKSFLDKFRQAIRQLGLKPDDDVFNNIDRGFQELTELIKSNPQDVINTCTQLGQTTFDIQIAMCYCGFKYLKMPVNTVAKHVLVDEVQDNSTFDFMFLLRYIITDKASLFIVGDASQTLYAFRNANPYALNILRNSGLFDIHQLKVNFRSKPEILTYANVLLNQIEANSFAEIQLHSNILKPATKITFKDKVKLQHLTGDVSDLADALSHNIQLKKYIDDCLARNEKVALITYSHSMLNLMHEAIKTLYSNKPVSMVDISSRKLTETTMFSDFWAELDKSKSQEYRNEARPDLLRVIHRDMTKDYSKLEEYIWTLMEKDNQLKLSQLNAQYYNNKISYSSFINQFISLTVQYEIRHNYAMQRLTSNHNTMQAKQDMINQGQLIFSTIHSVKGLEFDNVVLLAHNPDFDAEDEKRTFYVGLTRAKNSEFIISADNKDPNEAEFMQNYQMAYDELK